MMKIPEQEKDILAFWKDNEVFKKSLEKPSPKGDFVFYDGPPFATGLPHYGHILSSVIKDVVPRYWTMKGYHVRRRWGWDCHGLPIENMVEQKLGVSGKKDIEEKVGIEKFNETCRTEVLTYTAQWKDMVERIGRWVEFDNAYKTMDTTYMESVWRALKQLWDKELIYEGKKVLLYCPRCETPVSKFEVAMDNSYKDVTDTAVTVKFKLKSGQKIGNWEITDRTYILAWTTTPWTLPGNVALAVGENIEYVEMTSGGAPQESLIVAKSRVNEVGVSGSVGGAFLGRQLVGLEYEPLFDIPAVKKSGKKSHYITTADFVSTEEGTGVVHTAVMYGEDDFNLGKKIDLPMVPLLDSKGRFNEDAPKFIQGKTFKEADDLVIADLENRNIGGLIFKKEDYSHSYPHCWRCESALFYNAIDAWFIDIQRIKKRLIELNEKINWVPDHLKHGRFLNIVEEAPDWNISRNRYWATALPFWKCSTCKKTVCIGSIAELKGKAVNFNEVYKSDSPEDVDLHKHRIDKVVLTCECGGAMNRIPEVIDCWVESASMPFAEYHYPFENTEEFKKRFPGDYIAEYIAQTRTWFYYMHTLATALFDSISFKNVVTTGTILNEKGAKMSKSKRNYPDPWEVINAYGADALRFHLMSSVVMQSENLNFNEKEVREIYNKVINTVYNVVTFYQLYADDGVNGSQQSDHILDRWIISKLQQLIVDVTREMDGYDTVKATRAILDFVQELSTWYVRRSRDRFKDEATRGEAVATLCAALEVLAKVLAPFAPFAAEYIWRIVGSKDSISVHLSSWPTADKTSINLQLIDDMVKAKKVAEEAHADRAQKGIKVRQPLQKLMTPVHLPKELQILVIEEVNVKEFDVVKVSGAQGTTVSEVITPELRDEGTLRELTRQVNSLRKSLKLTPADIKEACYYTDSELLEKIILEYASELKTSTKTSQWSQAGKDSLTDATAVEVDDSKIFIALR